MVELKEAELKSFQLRSSKGNQLKWEKDGLWYKADYTGYEGFAEYIVSGLLKKSSLAENEFIVYEPVKIKYKNSVMNGAYSKNFLKDDWQIFTLERLYKIKTGRSFLQDVWHIPDKKDRLDFLTTQTQKISGIKDFGIYISKMLTIDAFFLNEDRHLQNVAILMNTAGDALLCPYFDHGGSLLSDTTLDYPPVAADLDETLYYMDLVKGKTICTDFEEALEVAEKLYGYNLKFTFDKKNVDCLIDATDVYDEQIKQRVKTVLYQQMHKYQYLF